MKKIIIFLLSGMLLLSGCGPNIKLIEKSENLNLKCTLNQKTTKYFTPFRDFEIIPKFNKIINLNLSNYKWSHKVERFPIYYYDEKKREIILVGQQQYILWDEVVIGDKINKNYKSNNSNNIVAQLFSYNWYFGGEFVMSVYNLNEKGLKEYNLHIDNQIKNEFVPPVDDDKKKTLRQKLYDDGLFSVIFRGECKRI